MFLLFVTFIITALLLTFFARSFDVKKSKVPSAAKNKMDKTEKDKIENSSDLKSDEEDDTIKHMLKLISKEDDEIDYNK